MLFLWGSSKDGRLGIPAENDGRSEVEVDEMSINEPTLCKSLEKCAVLGVSCGSRHTLAFDSCGKVYSWGWGACGQLGHGNFVNMNVPIQIASLDNHDVKFVSAGGMHSAAIINDGRVYMWGHGIYGQLGTGPLIAEKGSSANPTLLMQGQNGQPLLCKKISCGGMHTAAITIEGELYCWGRADSGQLGIGTSWVQESIQSKVGIEWPQHCTDLEAVPVDVSCGAFHTIVLTEDGNAYAFGKEDQGQLGCNAVDMLSGNLSKPYLMKLEDPSTEDGINDIQVKEISSGGWHTLILTGNGKIWSCGRGEFGRLGLGNESDKITLEKVEYFDSYPSRVKSISCGGTHTLVATEDNAIFSFGRTAEGRLGLGYVDDISHVLTPTPITSLQVKPELKGANLLAISAGGSHSAAVFWTPPITSDLTIGLRPFDIGNDVKRYPAASPSPNYSIRCN